MIYKIATVFLSAMLIVCIGYIVDDARNGRKKEGKSHKEDDD